MITPAYGCCCETAEPSGGCSYFAASVFNAACPARVTVEGDFTFEVFTAGGSSRGCLGMPTTRPLWGKLRRGQIHVSTTLHRVRCNLSTPYITQYKIQKSCVDCTDNDPNYPLLCPDDCSTYATGCRTYIARENPCAGDSTDEIGTEITCEMLMGLGITSERRMPCTGVQFHTCSHLGGSDGYTVLPGTGQWPIPPNPPSAGDDAIEKNAPLTATSAATGAPFDPHGCPTCFAIDKPIIGQLSPNWPSCTGTARCTSQVVSCEPCNFTVQENCVLPHIRAAVTGVTCYTVKDAYLNCVEAWIHIPLPELFSGPWRSSDPFVPTGIPNIKPSPAGTAHKYPRLLSAASTGLMASRFDNSEGFIRPSGQVVYNYPFSWAKKISTTPECIPQGQYVMYGNMGSGLAATVLNRCTTTCTGTNSLGQTLTYTSTTEDFTQRFTACDNYFYRVPPFNNCFEMYRATGTAEAPGDGSLPRIGVVCSDPYCCCRPWQTANYRSNNAFGVQECEDVLLSVAGAADSGICKTYPSKPFPQYTNVDQLTRYYSYNVPRNECTKGIGGGFVIRDRNHILWTCTGFRCCGTGWQCAVQATENDPFDVPCAGLQYEGETRVYQCADPTGGPAITLRCPTGTCLYNLQPHGLTTHIYVHLLREFPASLTLTWAT